MLLTINIPTLNRSKRVATLAKYLGHHVNNRWPNQARIVISDNHSEDETQQLLSSLDIPCIQYIKRETFIDSAEEHIIRLIEESNSDFIWLLGDDDIPNLRTLDLLISYLEQDAADIFVFNHSEILIDGDLLTTKMLEINSPYIDIPGHKLPLASGFISTLSMFSNVVFRRDCLSIEKGKELVKLSPIYSHVAWHIISFGNKRARVVNYQLVDHRADFKSINTYFEARHKAKKQSDYYIWTTGLLLLIKHLVENKYLSAQDVAMIFEHDFNGVRFRLLDRVMYYIFLRLQAAASDKIKNKSYSYNRISGIEEELFTDTILTSDARLQDQLFVLQRISNEINKNRTSWITYYLLARKFKKIHSAQTQWLASATTYIAKIHGYLVHKSLTGYTAITTQDGYHLQHQEEIMNQLDPTEDSWRVIVSDKLDDLVIKICDHSAIASLSKTDFNLAAIKITNLRNPSLESHYSLTPLRWVGKSMVLLRVGLAKFYRRTITIIMRKFDI